MLENSINQAISLSQSKIRGDKMTAKKPIKVKLTFNRALLALMLVLFATISIINSNFLYPDYLIGVMVRNIIEIGMMALPLTLIIITGGIDLSVGSIMVLSAMTGGMTAAQTGSSTLGLIVTLLTGLTCGTFNGILITKFRISPLIATLATMYLFMGVARGLSIGDSVYSYAASAFLGNSELFGLPIQIYFYILLAVIFYLVQAKTTYGRVLYGIGLNENASLYSGIRVNLVKVSLYAISGLVCAFSSLIWLGRFTSIKFDAGASLNLKVVTVVVLGGTSILGGTGEVSSTVIATMIVAILNSGLTVLNIPIDTQIIVQGMVLIVSLIAYSLINERIRKRSVIKPDAELQAAQ